MSNFRKLAVHIGDIEQDHHCHCFTPTHMLYAMLTVCMATQHGNVSLRLQQLVGLGLVSFCVRFVCFLNQGQFVSHRVSHFVFVLFGSCFCCQYQRN